MKALTLYTSVATLALAGVMLAQSAVPARAKTHVPFTLQVSKTSSTIVQSNILDAIQCVNGSGQVAAVEQTIIQTGFNFNLNAVLWKIPADQIDPVAFCEGLDFMNDDPLASVLATSSPTPSPASVETTAAEPTVIEQTIEQTGLNCNVNIRTLDLRDNMPLFDDVVQTNVLTATQKVLGLKWVTSRSQTVLQFGINMDEFEVLTELPDGDLELGPSLAELEALQSSHVLDLMPSASGSAGSLAPSLLASEPTLLVFQTIMQTGINLNFNLLSVLSDDPAPETPEEFRAYFPQLDQSNTLVATQVIQIVPEPGSLALLALGPFGLLRAFQRRGGKVIN